MNPVEILSLSLCDLYFMVEITTRSSSNQSDILIDSEPANEKTDLKQTTVYKPNGIRPGS